MVSRVAEEAGKILGKDHPTTLAFRSYIQRDDSTRYDGQAEAWIKLDVTHSNLQQRWHDIKVCKDTTVEQLKHKLHRHGGSLVDDMDLYLRRGEGASDTVLLADEQKTLRYYGADNGMQLHCVDDNQHSINANGALENTDLVEKYEMTDADYDKREKTMRNYKRQMQKVDPTFTFSKNPNAANITVNMDDYKVGLRCEVNPGGRRGEIMFIGQIGELKSKENTLKWEKAEGFIEKERPTFIGVKLDEPTGHNDGVHDGKKYFECPKGCGVFSKAENVTVGDFPELDPFADLESDDEI